MLSFLASSLHGSGTAMRLEPTASRDCFHDSLQCAVLGPLRLPAACQCGSVADVARIDLRHHSSRHTGLINLI